MKILKKIGSALLLLLLLIGVGRSIQIYAQSQYHGDRAPYLQMAGSDQITIRWDSADERVGKVIYGVDKAQLEQVEEALAGTAHQITLQDLRPNRQYYYQVEGYELSTFHTAPVKGSTRPIRLWVQGDPGYFTKHTRKVRDSALQWMAEHPRRDLPAMDLWLTTGDNAYKSGKAKEFQKELFDAYPELLATTPYMPTYGNHDARRKAFEKSFSFPEKGQLGGVPSNTWRYYSLDYGNLHLVFLDSESSEIAVDSEMVDWLHRDLSATHQTWKIVMIHHPPYTKGSHDSDSQTDSMGRMGKVREIIVPVLDIYNVDLVLNGHSHIYERSHLIGCHYGDSTTFNEKMVLDNASPYEKGYGEYSGTVYAVVGASAKLDDGPLDHPAMSVSLKKRGSLVIDIDDDVLSANYISKKGNVLDQFVIKKVLGKAGVNNGCHQS